MHRHVPVFLTVVALIGFRPLTTLADAPSRTSKSSRSSANRSDDDDDDDNECPFYGCPLLPEDVYFNTDLIKQALGDMRDANETLASSSHTTTKKQRDEARRAVARAEEVLSNSAQPDAATYTLIGYKGGKVNDQINQDRSFVVSPYYIHEEDNEDKENSDQQNSSASSKEHPTRILQGVFDGHAMYGEKVSEYSVRELPRMLAKKLEVALGEIEASFAGKKDDVEGKETAVVERTRAALTETFVELDRTAPADISGGCTATVVLLQGTKVYMANTGDSRSFIVAYRPSTKRADILYITREDKPHLPPERARVERMGGQVYVPEVGASRVVYQDPSTNSPAGLAMSRSIGDWAAGKLGVIPHPLVAVFDIADLVHRQLLRPSQEGDAQQRQQKLDDKAECLVMDEQVQQKVAAGTGSACSSFKKKNKKKAGTRSLFGGGQGDEETITTTTTADDNDDVHLFAVSATDGMMDFILPEDIARVVAYGLYGVTRGDRQIPPHLVSACEGLIYSAADGWQQAKKGRYRDDIAIAVTALRRPPTSTTTTNSNRKQKATDPSEL